MQTDDVLLKANDALKNFGNFSFDVLNIAKPETIEEAVNLCKIISKLSPVVGNLIEFRVVSARD